MNPPGKCQPLGLDSPMKISSNFIHVCPLKKSNFSSVWHGPLSRWLPFEHPSAKMGILDIDPVHSTLCPSITSTPSTSNFHSNMLQYSVSGLVMLDASTYGQDCVQTLLKGKGWGSCKSDTMCHLSCIHCKWAVACFPAPLPINGFGSLYYRLDLTALLRL